MLERLFFGLLTRSEGPIFDPLARTPRDIMSDTGKAFLTCQKSPKSPKFRRFDAFVTLYLLLMSDVMLN